MSASSSGGSTPKVAPSLTGAQADLAGLHLDEEVDEAEREKERERYREKPGLNMRQEELVAKVKKDEEESGKKSISLIVVGELTRRGGWRGRGRGLGVRLTMIAQDMWTLVNRR